MLRRGLTLLALVGLLTVPGCLHRGVLVSREGGHRLIARDATSGISVVLTTSAWDGNPPNLGDRFTVMHALVANMGKRPVLLAPGDLDLRDVRGFRHELLDAGGTFYQQTEDTSTIPLSYDPGRSRAYGTIETPDGDVHSAALPWGVLQPGTQMRGFLYFERIEGLANQARLVWHLGTPQHEPIVDLAFDLHVARPAPS